MAGASFTLNKDDWSLHRKGHQDQERHREKVKEAIKENLPDLVSDESIIMSNGKQIVKVPIRSLEEYRFRYNYNKSPQAGTGDGDSQVGDVIARSPSNDGQAGKGNGAGDKAGQDYMEADVALEEIERALFEEMELPNLQPKSDENVVTTQTEFRDVRKQGLMGNVDKRRTLLESIRRNALDGHKKMRIVPDDLRFKTWEDIEEPDSNAVVIAMMDTSGSMGLFEKYCARTFFFWMTRFLRTKYDTVQIRYIAHHTEAKEVSEEHFFSRGESGGTICSSAYQYAVNLIERDYSPTHYNIYPIHFSDGDNLTSDNERCLKLATQLCEWSQMFGYSEVNQYGRSSTLMGAFRKLEAAQFRSVVIRDRRGIYDALKVFFSAGGDEVRPA
jgi:uncharacterized protein